MKPESMLEEVITNIVKLATESQEHEKYIDKLKLLSESETYEELLALALIEKAEIYVKTVCSVSQLIHRHSFCQFLGTIFRHASENPKRFLRLQAAIMRIILTWDCNLRDNSNNLEESVECDAECLTFLLPVVGPKLEETFSSQLDKLFYNIRCSTLAEHLPKMLRSKLLDLLLLRASGWKSKIGRETLNFGKPFFNGNLSNSPVQECAVPEPVSASPVTSKICSQQLSESSKKEDVLLSPSEFDCQFNHEEIESKPPKSIDYSNLNPIPSGHLPVYVGVESPTTLQKNAPKASIHPKPPLSWLASEEYQAVQSEIKPERFHAYSPFRSSVSPTEDADLTRPLNLPTRRTPTVASQLREELPQYNGARPRTKLTFQTEDNNGEKARHLQSKIRPTLSSPNKPELISLPSTSGLVSTQPQDENCASHSLESFESARNESLGSQKSRPKVSWMGIEKINDFLRPMSDCSEESEIAKENGSVDVDSFSDDDIIVEQPTKKPLSTKKKTKWTPLSTATAPSTTHKTFPSKQDQPRKPVEVERTLINPTEHPFFKSQRICGVCGESDHITSACKKPLSSYFPADF